MKRVNKFFKDRCPYFQNTAAELTVEMFKTKPLAAIEFVIMWVLFG